jgi:hypothetical protein
LKYFRSSNRNREFQFPDILKNSLFFGAWKRPPWQAKCGNLCSVPRGPVGEREQNAPNFPVNFAVSREFDVESGSHETPSTAIESEPAGSV